MREVELRDAESPLVMAVDIGSSSVRAILYDAASRPVQGTEHRIVHHPQVTSDGGATIDADDLLRQTCACIDAVLAVVETRSVEIAAVGLTSFWHSLLGLDANHQPTTPVFMWSDTRSGRDADALAVELDEDCIHTETGCRLHSSYWPAKLHWLRRTQPERFDATAKWVSFPDYLAWTIHHDLATSISMASGTGLLHSSGAGWHGEMLRALHLTPDMLPALTDRDMFLPPPVDVWRQRWPALADAAWFPAIGDGAAANVGAGCVGDDRIALTIGTSGAMRAIIRDQADHEPFTKALSPKLWQYRLDRRSRVAGGAISNGGNVTAWFADLVNDHDFDRLTDDAAGIAPDGHGLTILPFLAGERSPSWNDDASGMIAGLTLATTSGAIFRSFLEATAYRFASIYDDLQVLVAPVHDIHANGAAALSSPLWMQILADALGHPITSLGAEAEASARGAAICALESIRVIDDLLDPGTPPVQQYEPDPERHCIYAGGRSRLERYESAMNTLITDKNARHDMEKTYS
ncbi:MAG TPA: gluconokinase [Thermomicrobiales bacterium]|nr:gluconokinase [Thermomicrobiales bacterium]